MAGEGSVFRRCGCTDPVTGRQYGSRCPRLAAGGRHGSWYVRLELPAGLVPVMVHQTRAPPARVTVNP